MMRADLVALSPGESPSVVSFSDPIRLQQKRAFQRSFADQIKRSGLMVRQEGERGGMRRRLRSMGPQVSFSRTSSLIILIERPASYFK